MLAGSARAAPAEPAEGEADADPNQQLSLFASAPSLVERELAKLDLEQLTPLEAMNELARLRALLG